MRQLTFADALPRLTMTYRQGKLVPFLGAGMSRPRCPSWAEMITGLAAEVGIQAATAHEASSEELIRYASRIGELLRRRGPEDLPRAVRRVLYPSGSHAMPAQTSALARFDWPLVVTTNYDDLLAREYNRRLARDAAERSARASAETGLEVEEVQVLGRGAQDCQRVSSSLDSSTGPILWALQGFLPPAGEHSLSSEIVLGHEEYRRATHAQPHFRRVFAEVFRRRSFLFLGSSLAEPYFLDLFGEVVEFFGANPAPHYALACDDLDDEFLRSRYNIIVVRYGNYGELPGLLAALGESALGDVPRQQAWAFCCPAPAASQPARVGVSADTARNDLTIVNSPIPTPDGTG